MDDVTFNAAESTGGELQGLRGFTPADDGNLGIAQLRHNKDRNKINDYMGKRARYSQKEPSHELRN
ncbi:hypothetical protein CERZMDRAFT_101844 [Cercospora zeae-maydis SCOH1-5]|uniref:Uncharacterized protein n=1 Tax=Cercospora zeae-maydis SCOH1-5 TaxID=717836 RepID=A0A6A6F3F8_9PEZI|nr:hypothetical protein CERZMDRAFT_101844 [Cercospora zeae-maydis SCOH1-5]